MAKLGELYPKIFVTILPDKEQMHILTEIVAKRRVKKSFKESFDTPTPDKRVIRYIENIIEESPYHYITVIDTLSTQGAIPTCEMQKAKEYINTKNISLKCFNSDGWSYYSRGVGELLEEYEDLGVDLIYSPFVLLAHMFDEYVQKSCSLYILADRNFLTLAIFKGSQLLYAKYIDMPKAKEEEIRSQENAQQLSLSGIDIHEISLDDDEEDLGSLIEMEDLDIAKDDLEDFVIEDTFGDSQKSDGSVQKSDLLNRNYERFVLVQKALDEFYHSDLYKGEFVEHVYIADAITLENDLKDLLEDELFLSVQIKKVDILSTTSYLARAEIL